MKLSRVRLDRCAAVGRQSRGQFFYDRGICRVPGHIIVLCRVFFAVNEENIFLLSGGAEAIYPHIHIQTELSQTDTGTAGPPVSARQAAELAGRKGTTVSFSIADRGIYRLRGAVFKKIAALKLRRRLYSD